MMNLCVAFNSAMLHQTNAFTPPDVAEKEFCTHHIDVAVMLQDSHTEQEGEEQLMLLEQRATHVTVEAEREVVVDVLRPLLHRICENCKSNPVVIR